MGNRYSDIKRGAQLKEDLENYIQYLNTPRTANVGSGTARGAQRTLFLSPFGQDLEPDEVVQVSANSDSYDALSSYIVAGNGAQLDTVPGTNQTISLPKYQAARVVWFRNSTRNVSVARSKVTNWQYLKYQGDRDSCPFGRATATDDQMDVFNAIKADILSSNPALAVNRVSLTREKIGL